MLVRLTQLDGSLPNLALMKLASWHRSRGDEVVLTSDPVRDLLEPRYDVVYGAAIFNKTAPVVAEFLRWFPEAIVGGTWDDEPGKMDAGLSVEQVIGGPWEHYDYQDYPNYTPSIGFTQRGCRFQCGFCGVWRREGKPRAVNSITDIYRGDGHAKELHLLDNDFFGQPREAWRQRISEIIDGKFSVCFNQGINIRVIDEEAAEALGSLKVEWRAKTGRPMKKLLYRDDQFSEPRLYTAWDNIGHEAAFFRGVELLNKHGVPPNHLMAYMLVGYDPAETWERVFYRFNAMVKAGILPYPMPYKSGPIAWDDRGTDPRGRSLVDFQRWVVWGLYRAKPPKAVPWDEYDSTVRTGKAAVTGDGSSQLLMPWGCNATGISERTSDHGDRHCDGGRGAGEAPGSRLDLSGSALLG